MSNSRRERGFSLIELLIVVAIILIIMGIAIPNLMKSRMTANQAAAVGALKTINAAAVTYSATYGNGYPPSLAALGPPPGGGSSSTCDNSNLIDSLLASGRRNGYVFTYTGVNPLPSPAPNCSSPGFNAYSVEASPELRGKTGEVSYFTDQSGVVHFNATQPATANDPPLQ
jgi:type IV pilus assembly protein PilA